jgi:hypothetical protein
VLTWEQVLAWRMRRQWLDPREASPAGDVVRRLCGVQAQVASAARLGVAVRQAEPDGGEVDRALDERTLVKTWAMRGTLHLLAPEDAGAYLALVGAARSWEKPSWQRSFGVSTAHMADLAEAVSEALDGRVLTRDELVEAVVARTGGPELEEHLRSGWGAVLKPLAWQGQLCHGPARGTRVTFARPDTWIPGWKGIRSEEDAARVVIPAFLGAHGPATIEAFDRWLTRGASKKGALRGWFAALEDELVSVQVEGEQAYARAEDADELAATPPAAAVRLLPGFDQYVLGAGTNAVEVIPAEHRAAVSRAAGWISPVVVTGGRVTGVWEIDGDTVAVRPFDDAAAVDRDALEAEVAHVARFLGRELALRCSRT